MKVEVEAKIKIDSAEAILCRLVEMHAVFQTTVWEEDIYFDSSEGLLMHQDCGLRLRKRIIKGKGEQFILTFKGPRQPSAFKSRSETETVVANYEGMMHILEQMGYQKCLRVEKKRKIWHMGTCEVCLDEVATLGQFVEIEGPDQAAVAAVVLQLGLDPKNHISEGYARLTAMKLAEGK